MSGLEKTVIKTGVWIHKKRVRYVDGSEGTANTFLSWADIEDLHNLRKQEG